MTRWPRWPSELFSHSSALHSCRRLFTSGNAHLEACEESRGCAYRLSESRDGLFSIVSVMSRGLLWILHSPVFPKDPKEATVSRERGHRPHSTAGLWRRFLLVAQSSSFCYLPSRLSSHTRKDATTSAPAAGLPKTIQTPYGCRIHRVGDDEAGVHAAETFIATTPQQSHPTVEIRCSRHAETGRTMPSIYATECSQRSSCLLRGKRYLIHCSQLLASNSGQQKVARPTAAGSCRCTAWLIQPTLRPGVQRATRKLLLPPLPLLLLLTC